MAKRCAFYVRTSTDRQSVENQVAALTAIAERRGWKIIETYRDAGISGTKGRNGRPGLDAALTGAKRHHFDILMVWAIDRLGRSLTDLLSTIKSLETWGTELYIDQQNIDTTSPMGRVIFVIFGALAEFERTHIVSRINAGIARAKAAGKTFGRPKIAAKLEAAIVRTLKSGKGIHKTAREHGVGVGTVQRIKREMAAK